MHQRLLRRAMPILRAEGALPSRSAHLALQPGRRDGDTHSSGTIITGVDLTRSRNGHGVTSSNRTHAEFFSPWAARCRVGIRRRCLKPRPWRVMDFDAKPGRRIVKRMDARCADETSGIRRTSAPGHGIKTMPELRARTFKATCPNCFARAGVAYGFLRRNA